MTRPTLHPALNVRTSSDDGVHQISLGEGAVVEVDADVARVVAGPLLGRPATRILHLLRERWEPTPVAVHLRGRRIDHLPTAARVRRGLAVVAGSPVAPDVSVRDHLAAIAGRARADAALAGAPLLAGRGEDPAGVLSGGERRVLGWLRAELLRPTAVVLDRATEGLDPDTVRWATGVVRRWHDDGVAVIFNPARPEERAWAEPTLP